ncbi:MAG: hypothetical protein KDB40_12830 [Acidimicrobiales bacterium]|nr:hypothetical protein [Acidimicrobiales bacterium]
MAKEIGELMRVDSTGFAVIDLDAVAKCTVDPPVPGRFESELMVANLGSIWPNYRRYGVERLVLARAVVTADELADLRGAVPKSRWTICRLAAPEDVIDRRLRAREPGVSQEFIVGVSRSPSAEMDQHSIADFVVDNGSESVTVVAGEVLRRWRELA